MAAEQTKQFMNQAQLYQQQMQNIAMQKESLNMQSLEINNALEELGKAKEKDVYRLSGPILIKAVKNDVTNDLEEKKSFIDIKLKTLEKSEQKIKAKIDDMREQMSKTGTGS